MRIPADSVVTENEALRPETEQQVFGRSLTDEEYAILAGVCRPGTEVKVTFEDKNSFHGVAVRVRASCPQTYSATLIFKREKVVLYSVKVEDNQRGTGLAWELFYHQAKAAASFGFPEIIADLKCLPEGHPQGRHDGYYKGARWGFNAPLGGATVAKLTNRLMAARCLHDLMRTEDGQRFWFVHGERVPNATFDLHPRSECWAILGVPPGASGEGPAEAEEVE